MAGAAATSRNVWRLANDFFRKPRLFMEFRKRLSDFINEKMRRIRLAPLFITCRNDTNTKSHWTPRQK